jgi:hypothetical protein
VREASLRHVEEKRLDNRARLELRARIGDVR